MFLNLELQDSSSIAAIDCEGFKITYGELVDAVSHLGKSIIDRTITFCLCKNTVGSLVGYLSLVDCGSVPLMLSSKIDTELLSDLLAVYKPQYIWCPKEQVDRFSGDILNTTFDYCLIPLNNAPYPIHDDLQLLMTTSGSTGSPKLVRYKKGNLEANAKNVAKAFGWTSAERSVCNLGMQYTMGLNVINTHLYVGATLLLTHYNLMGSDFWDYIKREKATNFTGVPFSYEILSRLRFQNMDLPYLTTLAAGGGKLTNKRFIELAEYAKKTRKRFIATFGTTETSARMSFLPAELATDKTGSIGHAIPEGELFLTDADGNILIEPETEGELCYRGPNVTMGYALSAEDLNLGDEWNGIYHTGDLAKRDSDGYYYVTGRMSRFLKLLSYRVSLDQCEGLIREKFNIECACTGNDQRMDIYITDGSLVSDVQDFVCKRTGLYKSLFKVFVLDKIPRNESGKIAYKKLTAKM